MKQVLIILSVVSSVLLFSCQKEVDFANRGGGSNGSQNGLLKKAVYKAGLDSTVITYSYNASGKLIDITTTGSNSGFSIYNQKIISRNSQGIIQKVVMKDADFILAGIDSIVFNTRYDVSASRYTALTFIIDYGSGIEKDSIAYIYNSAGKIITESGYIDDGTGTYSPSGKVDYTHSGNNIVTKKIYSYDLGVYSIEATITDEFDTKIAPLILGIEGIIIEGNSLAPYYSSNNITKETATYPSDPDESLNISYTYNSSSRPSSAVYNIQPGNQSYNVAYYYQ